MNEHLQQLIHKIHSTFKVTLRLLGDAETIPTKPTGVVLLAAGRCGSNLLKFAFRDIGFAGFFEAYIRPNRIYKHFQPDIESDDTSTDWYKSHVTKPMLHEYMLHCIKTGTSDENIFGIKFHPRQRQILLDILEPTSEKDFVEVISTYFSDMKFIHMVRRNKVAQAVSFAKAHQDGRWTSISKKEYSGSYVYNYEEIVHHLVRLMKTDIRTHQLLDQHHIQPIVVTYEDFVNNYEETLRELLVTLSTRYNEAMIIPQPPLKKQANNINQEWEKRFRNEASDWLTADVEQQLIAGILPDTLPTMPKLHINNI